MSSSNNFAQNFYPSSVAILFYSVEGIAVFRVIHVHILYMYIYCISSSNMASSSSVRSCSMFPMSLRTSPDLPASAPLPAEGCFVGLEKDIT